MSYYLLEACSFQMRDRNKASLERREDGEEMGEVEGGKTVIRVYCMRRESYVQ